MSFSMSLTMVGVVKVRTMTLFFFDVFTVLGPSVSPVVASDGDGLC